MKLKTAGGKQANKIKAPRSRPCKGISQRTKNTAASLTTKINTPDWKPSRCGQPFFINRAGDILLVSLMRHLTSRPQQSTGLFQALSDPRIARSLVAMHTKPAHPWTLESLANLAGMSRTSFANNFKDMMHVTPGKYLENLRLAIARQLVQTGIGLKQIATRTGYSSPSTLSRALGRSS
jgi:transcriptional regulator GlxA family with amidase domain